MGGGRRDDRHLFTGNRRAAAHWAALAGCCRHGRDTRHGRVDGHRAGSGGGVFRPLAAGGRRPSGPPHHADADDGGDGHWQPAVGPGHDLYLSPGRQGAGGDEYWRFLGHCWQHCAAPGAGASGGPCHDHHLRRRGGSLGAGRAFGDTAGGCQPLAGGLRRPWRLEPAHRRGAMGVVAAASTPGAGALAHAGRSSCKTEAFGSPC